MKHPNFPDLSFKQAQTLVKNADLRILNGNHVSGKKHLSNTCKVCGFPMPYNLNYCPSCVMNQNAERQQRRSAQFYTQPMKVGLWQDIKMLSSKEKIYMSIVLIVCSFCVVGIIVGIINSIIKWSS